MLPLMHPFEPEGPDGSEPVPTAHRATALGGISCSIFSHQTCRGRRTRSFRSRAGGTLGIRPQTKRAAHNECMQLEFSLASYSLTIANPDYDDSDRYAALMHQLPRQFHSLTAAEQAAALPAAPPLTGTKWDALLAAVAEHIARLHDHPVPDWCDEPERFLDIPWVISTNRVVAADSVLYAPGAFIRHGALPDPADLDARGGDEHAWIP